MGYVVGLFWVDPLQLVNHQTLRFGGNKVAAEVPNFACRWHPGLLRPVLCPDPTVDLPTWLLRADFVPKAAAQWDSLEGLAPSVQRVTRCGYEGTKPPLAPGTTLPTRLPPGGYTESAPQTARRQPRR